MINYFSIVIPTKNRTSLLELSIKSVKNQTFQDYELIVIDNDDESSSKEKSEYLYDEKVIYVRTGGLSMVDNWNIALSNSNGKWVMLLEDKQMLYPDALKKIYDCIENNNINTTLNFNTDWYNDLEKKNGLGYVKRQRSTGKLTKLSTKDVLRDYEKSLVERDSPFTQINYFPLPQMSVVSNALLQETKKRYGSYCSFGAPDFTSALKKLTLSQFAYHLDESITLVSTMKHSNGMSSAINREAAHKRDIVNAPMAYKKKLASLRFKELSTYNVFLLDYMMVFDKDLRVDDQVYMIKIFEDIYNIYAIKNKVDLSESIKKFNFVLDDINHVNKILIKCIIFKHRLKIRINLLYLNIKSIIKKNIFFNKFIYKSAMHYMSTV